ncbi:MAG: haloacid dehalogenase [Deltaproteobacteria bacterium HGW-Deltaproteobacteria-14]|jgi:phosphoglycolate phosphatase-like HAD superfamily hydrolase|nr:MAG: haloacid dehalogenase [Deltaproteobacteria bacterium HGW-Deltaproteobacteria-14]
MIPTIHLFDIDGTLVTGDGAGRRALMRVFDRRYGRPDALDRIVFHGATDRAIMREALLALAVAHDDAHVDAVLAEYVAELPELVGADGYRAHRGVLPLLEALDGRPGLALGLGTGNIEAGARVKLTPPDLNRFFPFGGFGSDAEDRAELLAIGAARGAARLGVARAACRVVVIGDTLRDVQAAHAIGAFCVAVATGGNTADELRAARAEVVVDSLDDPAAVAALTG